MPGELRDNRGRGDARWTWPPIHPEGRKFGLIAGAVALGALLLGWTFLVWPLILLAGAILAFFRDPERVVPQGDDLIVSPADGMVTLIQQVVPPPELRGDEPSADGSSGRGLGAGPVTRVSIFMSVFDVHINRAPSGGTVRRIVYVPGTFINADLDKASDDNERQHLLVERPDGVIIGFTQIAGLVARRIVAFAKPGDVVATGQRIGLIRFGSRVDVYLPAGTEPLVVPGQTAIAGETVIAQIGRAGLIEGVRQ